MIPESVEKAKAKAKTMPEFEKCSYGVIPSPNGQWFLSITFYDPRPLDLPDNIEGIPVVYSDGGTARLEKGIL